MPSPPQIFRDPAIGVEASIAIDGSTTQADATAESNAVSSPGVAQAVAQHPKHSPPAVQGVDFTNPGAVHSNGSKSTNDRTLDLPAEDLGSAASPNVAQVVAQHANHAPPAVQGVEFTNPGAVHSNGSKPNNDRTVDPPAEDRGFAAAHNGASKFPADGVLPDAGEFDDQTNHGSRSAEVMDEADDSAVPRDIAGLARSETVGGDLLQVGHSSFLFRMFTC